MVEVFKTNVQEASEAKQLVALLLQRFPDNKINVDLHDCDKILRIEGDHFEVQQIVMLAEQNGFACRVLE